MPALRPMGRKGIVGEEIAPGDTMILGEVVGVNADVGASTITAQQLLSGVVYRSGSTAAYTDTLDSAANVLAALTGNNPGPAVVSGSSFRFRIVNSVAFAQTLTLGNSMTTGLGTITGVPASSWRDFLAIWLCPQVPVNLIGSCVSGSPTLTFSLPHGQAGIPQGSLMPNSVGIMIGSRVQGTGIAGGSVTIGLIQGTGGLIGATMDRNATSTSNNVTLTFAPNLNINGIGSGTL